MLASQGEAQGPRPIESVPMEICNPSSVGKCPSNIAQKSCPVYHQPYIRFRAASQKMTTKNTVAKNEAIEPFLCPRTVEMQHLSQF